MSSHLFPLPGENTAPDLRQRAPRRGTDLRLSLVRGRARLPWRTDPAEEELPSSDVLRMANAVSATAGAFLVGGGEPLMRHDLLILLENILKIRPEDLGLCTAGLGMTTAVARRLESVGVQRVTIPFHAARKDAHDWLVGRPGALKTALRAVQACLEANLPITAEIVVTRPTVAHLAETVDALTKIGVRSLCLRRLRALDVGAAEFVALSPRLTLVAGDLERAAAIALHRRARLVIRDFPVCAAPRLRRLFAAPDQEIWVTPDGPAEARLETGIRCTTCVGPPTCHGAPPDYLSRFGGEEVVDRTPKLARVQETVAQQLGLRRSGTLVMSWKSPRRLTCDACADGDALAEPESTRVIRARLVDAARHRPAVLRLVGADLFAHPSAAALLYDAIRLFPHVECAGEASPIAKWKAVDVSRVKPLKRIDVPFFGPDAATHDDHCGVPGSFAETLEALARLEEDTSIPIGAYAVLHDASLVRAFAEAWDRGKLPGPPRFRLSARGSALTALVECARELPPGATRAALLNVLPRCACKAAGLTIENAATTNQSPEEPWFAVTFGQPVDWSPCGADPVGEFSRCASETCMSSGCPGIARGWE